MGGKTPQLFQANGRQVEIQGLLLTSRRRILFCLTEVGVGRDTPRQLVLFFFQAARPLWLTSHRDRKETPSEEVTVGSKGPQDHGYRRAD